MQQSTSGDAGAASQRDSLTTFQSFPLKELLSTGRPEVWKTAGGMVPPASHLPALPWVGSLTRGFPAPEDCYRQDDVPTCMAHCRKDDRAEGREPQSSQTTSKSSSTPTAEQHCAIVLECGTMMTRKGTHRTQSDSWKVLNHS